MQKILLCALVSLIASPAMALKTDTEQPIEIHANRFNGDEVKQTAIYTGNVVVTQGSIQLTGGRLELKVTPKGYRQATITGNPARFRQQRDTKVQGADEWMHAQASNIIYNEENDTVTLRGNARLSRTENGIQKDSTSGNQITYDMRNARSLVEGDGERVTTIIAPRANTKQPTTNKGTANLSNATTLSNPKK